MNDESMILYFKTIAMKNTYKIIGENNLFI